MKPKERLLNYALLSSASCAPKATGEGHAPFKQDIPIDLSVRKKVVALEVHHHHHYSLSGAQPGQLRSPPPPAMVPHPNEWLQSKYCLPNLMPVKPYGYPPASLLPYLFINPNCFAESTSARVPGGVLYHAHPHYGTPHETFSPVILPPSSHYNSLLYDGAPRPARASSDKLPASTGSSACSTSSSSPSNNAEYHYPDCNLDHVQPSKSASKVIFDSVARSQHGSPVRTRRSRSASSLAASMIGSGLRRRTPSENHLHLITNFTSLTNCTKVCAPKKLFASNYYQSKLKQEMRDNLLSSSGETRDNQTDVDNKKSEIIAPSENKGTKSYRNYRKEAIESWGMENQDSQTSTAAKNNENALDLRTNMQTSLKENGDKMSNVHQELVWKLGDSCSAQHMDLYRQYYCYLLQDAAFTSKAAMAAVVEAYTKIMTSPPHSSLPSDNKSPLSDKQANMCDTRRVSPDFILNASKSVELCSADTTITFDRKRISRPLTGKHVRHGTGASPSTLVTLRNMIQQRLKFREHAGLGENARWAKNKHNNKRVKRK